MPIISTRLFELEERARPILIHFLEDMVRIQEREAESILAQSSVRKKKTVRPAGQAAEEQTLEPADSAAAEKLKRRAKLTRTALKELSARPAIDPAALRVVGTVRVAPGVTGVKVRLRDEKPARPPVKVVAPVSSRGDFVIALRAEKATKAGTPRSFVVEPLDAKGKPLGPPSQPFQFVGEENFFQLELLVEAPGISKADRNRPSETTIALRDRDSRKRSPRG